MASMASCTMRAPGCGAPRKSPVPSVASRAVSRTAVVVVRASASKQMQRMAAQLPAAVMVAAAAALTSPLMAEAAVTPSLRNFLYSLLAGGSVLGGIAFAITAVSNFDPVNRED
ncbi:uncharacterized protein HaLaN_11060 [Haematococcus lacustris]|uniref:Photosystem II reaction center X protein n=1 Tax=Haematococcus lacustris TaxID=44745 RepID=A0A699YZ16_HAELA|nr:uncharacterized protein HaLaN_11060 [Haematococcus lacustris]